MEIEIIISLVVFAFFAGAIDAAVGGGGLIQIPAIMGSLPHLQPATVFGTNKLASIFGTASAAFSYLRQVKLPWLLMGIIAACSFISSFIGAASVTLIPVEILKPFCTGDADRDRHLYLDEKTVRSGASRTKTESKNVDSGRFGQSGDWLL